ncbi:unnamed protein product [Hydatigera taeniaeformis]|uniref:Myosin motor domain-containing protein n=1 Tax=Hydatigena taeniaeformis TaxID=6205 RepID=A0A0R3X0E3_HYDTA|nr:unnamed protein product [Hydatigera taeniaeformis]
MPTIPISQFSIQEGSSLWIPQSKSTWRPAAILKVKSDGDVLLRWLDSNKQETVDLNTYCTEDSPLFDCGYGRTPQIDLSGLDFINEPEGEWQSTMTQAHALGLLLIAINPYDDLPIYGMEFMSAYNQNNVDNETRRDPHIFAIADEAFSRMKLLQQNQSIIISGESGAGKTVSARHVLKYLTAMTTRHSRGLIVENDTASMAVRVLASSPLLESLGNARTIHNDNSSRFGKFLEVGFSQVGHCLVRACIKTYLLEKSRVVLQDKNERNYHIFYQLLAAASDPKLKKTYSFLNEMALDRSATYHYAAKWRETETDDLEDFVITLQSMKDLHFSDDEVKTVLKILAAILHLGNVTYEEISRGDSQLTGDGERSLQEAFRLLRCDVHSDSRGPAYSCLCFRIIHTVEGEMHKPLTVLEAISARDALAKLIYQVLFEWIVTRCNESLAACSEKPTEDNFIGILDIYGFETNEVNSFEQFCINYANEKLQQRFIKNVFQLEQEEYIHEGLEWSFVEYYSNEPCIQLLEGPMGVIALLNDECKLPKPQDRNWLGRLCNEHLGRSRDFSQSKFWAAERFTIQHFSEKVEYAVDGFVEKNLDRIIPEHADLLTNTKANDFSCSSISSFSTFQILSRKGDATTESLWCTTNHKDQCCRLSIKVRHSLFILLCAFESLHGDFRKSLAAFRWTYEDFLSRYWRLCPDNHRFEKDPVKKSEIILHAIVKATADPDRYRLGRTKIFFGNGVLAHLERAHSARITLATIVIQKYVRGWLTRRRYQPILRQITAIQAFARRWLAREHLQALRQSQQRKLEASEATKFALETGPSKTYNRALSLLRRHKTLRPSKTEADEGKTRTIEMLEREITSLRSQLKARDSEIAVKESQISKLMKKEEEGVEDGKKRKHNRLNNHKGSRSQPDRDFGDYEEVNYHSRHKLCRNLHKITPVGVELKALTEDFVSTSGQKIEIDQQAKVNINLLLDLQARCSSLDAEKEELYRKLEMYQESFVNAQARQLEAQGKIRLQKEIDILNAEKSQLESTLNERNEELRLFKECYSSPSGTPLPSTLKQDMSTQDDIENRVSRLAKDNLVLQEQLSTANALNRRLTSATKYFAELVHRRAPDCLQMTTSPYLLDIRQLIAVAQSRVNENGVHDFTAKSKLLRCMEGKEEIFIEHLVKGKLAAIVIGLTLCLMLDLDVQKAKSWAPLAVAELVFLLLRGADAVHNEAQISTLLTATIRAVQCVINRQSSSKETIIFWMINSFGLRNCIYKFSDNGGGNVSDEERVYELQNYDISPFIPLLNDVITLAFQLLMAQVAEVVFPQALVTGALLEYEPIPNLTCQALTVSVSGGLRPQNTWLRRKPHFKRFIDNLDSIFDFLTGRPNFCCHHRHNLATLETWLSDRDLVPEASQSDVYRQGRHLQDLLLPLIQVCHILQSKKGGSDKVKVSSLCQLCPNLTTTQILRLLSRCTLVNGLEEVVQPEFLAAMRRRLREQRPQETYKTICCGLEVSQTTLLLDSYYWGTFNEVLSYAPLPNSLTDFQIPPDLERLSQFLVTVAL